MKFFVIACTLAALAVAISANPLDNNEVQARGGFWDKDSKSSSSSESSSSSSSSEEHYNVKPRPRPQPIEPVNPAEYTMGHAPHGFKPDRYSGSSSSEEHRHKHKRPIEHFYVHPVTATPCGAAPVM